MGTGYKHGSGGAALNFKVVGNPQPSSPKENTIWIDTDVPITSYIFSATEPETPVDGMVWISTGTSSAVEFNALKKNEIQVYPLSAKQYVSGAWVDKTAKTYQSGEWVDWWNGEIYDNGNQYESITGGWFPKNSKWNNGIINDNGNLYAAGSYCMFGTVKPLSRGQYNNIYFNVEKVVQHTSNPNVYIVLTTEQFDDSGDCTIAITRPTKAGTVTLSLENVDGDFYVFCYTYNANEILEISKIWME